MTKIERILSYFEQAAEQFKKDPADSSYQRGYQAALEDAHQFIKGLNKE